MPTSGVRGGPVTTSTLSGVPLAHALIYIRNKRLSGVLELRASADRHAWLVFWRGLVVSSMTTPAVARFGTVVYELGFIDGDTLDATTRESARTERPQMDILLERGAITHEQCDQILVEQVRRRVHHLFTLPPTTTFSFREGRPSTAEPVVIVDVLAPVWRGLRDFPPDARAVEVLARIGDHPLRLVSEALIERAELAPEEVAVCEALARKPMTLVQLRASSKLPPARVDLIAYLLVITKCVEVEGLERAPLPSAAMWAAANVEAVATPATHTSSERISKAATLRGPADLGPAAIRRRAAAIEAESPFTALGLEAGASAEAARAAYFRLGRLWHPDRLAIELDEVRAEVERIWAHMTQAHRVLTDPASRGVAVSRKRR